ncbi:MAG: hypothetical protein KatS3mg115_1976 [Candidatus Poribacteria bacterium]|nr:MAG: hypothetical protein KatS3mg115_1976 [Candidatus Poribacteria bacterium]
MTERCCEDVRCEAPALRSAACPECGVRARRVAPDPIVFYVPGFRPVAGQSYFLCENPECETVYFDSAGERWTREAVRLRFGFKEKKGPRLVCYCFGHTEEEIEAELRVHGKTTVPERIRAEIAAGTCECEFRNPRGKCCLGEVTAAAKRLATETSEYCKGGKGMNPSRLSLGAVLSGIAAGLCCLGPLAIAFLGIGSVGLFRAVEPLRPVFILLTFVLLAYAFYRLRRMEAAGCCEAEGFTAAKALLGRRGRRGAPGDPLPLPGSVRPAGLGQRGESNDERVRERRQRRLKRPRWRQRSLPPTVLPNCRGRQDRDQGRG